MMSKQHMRALVGALLLALCLAPAFAAFESRTLDVDISFNPDGSAHVSETVVMFITTQQSIANYENSNIYNDLSSWRSRTGIEDLQPHVTPPSNPAQNFRVQAQPTERCNSVAQTCFGHVQWEYDIPPESANSSGLLSMGSYKPRTTLYSLNNGAFKSYFPVNKTGDILLSRGSALRFVLPSDASKISFSKLSANLVELNESLKFDSRSNKKYYDGKERTFTWSGETLPQFEMSFEIEQPLEKEIINFFSSVQNAIFSLLRSDEGLAIVLVCSVFVLSAVAIHTITRSSQ